MVEIACLHPSCEPAEKNMKIVLYHKRLVLIPDSISLCAHPVLRVADIGRCLLEMTRACCTTRNLTPRQDVVGPSI